MQVQCREYLTTCFAYLASAYMGRGVVRAWPGPGNRICLHFEQWCGPVLPMASEMLSLQPVLVKPVLHFLTSSHHLPWRRLFTNSTQSIPDPGSGCPGPCISKYSLLIKLLSGFLVQVLWETFLFNELQWWTFLKKCQVPFCLAVDKWRASCECFFKSMNSRISFLVVSFPQQQVCTDHDKVYTKPCISTPPHREPTHYWFINIEQWVIARRTTDNRHHNHFSKSPKKYILQFVRTNLKSLSSCWETNWWNEIKYMTSISFSLSSDHL